MKDMIAYFQRDESSLGTFYKGQETDNIDTELDRGVCQEHNDDAPTIAVSSAAFDQLWDALAPDQRIGHSEWTAQGFASLWDVHRGCWVIISGNISRFEELIAAKKAKKGQ